jgi:hypothetical protein
VDEQPLQEYAWAIGTAILALNEAESEIFSLLQQLIESEQSDLPEQELEATISKLEASVFSEKINRIEEIANRCNPAVRARLIAIVAEGRRLGDERNNFAHGLLWLNPFDGKPQRRFVPRRTAQPMHDARTPQQIIDVSLEIEKLTTDVIVTATELRNN